MTGWKTKLGGVGMIFTGLGLVIAGILSDPINGEMLGGGFASISMGLGLIGIGHKVEKAGKL